MVWIARSVVIAVGIAGGVVTSQAPEFTQQYRQRLGGALQELRAVVADFQDDASRNDLSTDEALAAYRVSGETFMRDRGRSIAKTVHRFESLQRQALRFETWPEIVRPAALVGEADAELVRGAWADFKPAVPVTVTGLAWAFAGFFLAALFAHGFRRTGSGMTGAARRRGIPATRQGEAAYHAVDTGDAPEVAVDPDGPVAGNYRG
jgi:hypothetical protein